MIHHSTTLYWIGAMAMVSGWSATSAAPVEWGETNKGLCCALSAFEPEILVRLRHEDLGDPQDDFDNPLKIEQQVFESQPLQMQNQSLPLSFR